MLKTQHHGASWFRNNKFPWHFMISIHKHIRKAKQQCHWAVALFSYSVLQGINLHPFWKEMSKCQAKYGSTNTQQSTKSAWIKLNYTEKTLKLMWSLDFQMCITHWTQKREEQRLTRFVFTVCEVMEEVLLQLLSDGWELGKLEPATKHTLLYKRPALHFNSIFRCQNSSWGLLDHNLCQLIWDFWKEKTLSCGLCGLGH